MGQCDGMGWGRFHTCRGEGSLAEQDVLTKDAIDGAIIVQVSEYAGQRKQVHGPKAD